MKIFILAAALAALSLLAPAGRAAGEVGEGGALSSFSGDAALRELIWRLAAFVPAGEDGATERSIYVDGVKGLPPVTIRFNFGEPLDPWPQALALTFQAEDTRPPVYFTLSDARPFGGPNIRLDGPAPGAAGRREAANPQKLQMDILSRLSSRLMAVRPKIGPIKWQLNSPGFESARAKLLYGARLGSDDLYLMRFDPAEYAFKPYHENESAEESQLDIGGWLEKLPGASAVINGGQYYPDRRYMGLLLRDGLSLSAGAHSSWKACLVSLPGPAAPEGAPQAAIIDLADDSLAIRPEHYLNVMQSFMMLDHKGVVRVRDSRSLAGRSAVAEDGEGRILLIMTPAAVTLFDLATALKSSSSLGLKRVMGLDGGFESQLALRLGDDSFMAGGQFSITDKKAVYIPGYHPALPAVLAAAPLAPQGAEDTVEDTPGQDE